MQWRDHCSQMLSERVVPRLKLGTIGQEGPRRRRQSAVMEPSVIATLIKRAVGETESTSVQRLDGFFCKWDEISSLPLPEFLSEH